ncbi:MAG TPA: PhoX family phosphatase [Steroidobacter sp.]
MTRSDTPTFADLLARRITRRRVLQAAASLAPLAAAGSGLFAADDARANGHRGWSFEPIAGSAADEIVLPKGYRYDIIARWGDSLWSSTPNLDATKLAAGVLFEPEAAARQARQFGQNCDAVQYFPLDRSGSRGILCVNNEYTDDALMFPGHPGFVGAVRGLGSDYVRQHPGLVAVAKAAQGVSIVEIERKRGRWRMVKDSRFNRRITAETPIEISGPARGSALMRTRDDPNGVRVLGTFGNCAGGRTPWGTYLTAEENIQDYFGHLAELAAGDETLREAHRRFRMWKNHSLYGWEVVDSRFDLRANPCEPFRFGWIVEIDPRDPTRPPVKRTALGRFAHESASPIVAHDGRVAVYMGDDDKFEYVYKFVSADRFDPKNPEANRNLLDRGTLYVARFEASGKGRWLPLVFDPKGPLNAAAGFADQAQVLIKARAAADILGATPMDRPEDVEVNPVTGRIYVPCTRNERRAAEGTKLVYAGREIDAGPDAANPRPDNRFGHIIEIREANDDHTSEEFSWEVFLLAGDPSGDKLITDLEHMRPDSAYYAGYGKPDELSPIGSPDNIGFDSAGNLWVVTDGPQPGGGNDGCWMCPTTGPERGRLQQFMSGPKGAEICGCQFSDDGETFFLSIQHPGEGGSVTEPVSHWPDGPGMQPRSSVIAITRT